ncbi:hypothetical protein [Dendronalium sp. ChiSLP03b]|uniref:hypothetical protein n=1 Tax=Dendronalium sp. ChiSLP03b TaxID=3075381 RepID=UPI00391A0A7E
MEQELIKLDDRLAIRIDKKTKEEFSNRLKAEGKNPSEVMLSWIKDFLQEDKPKLPDLAEIAIDVKLLKDKVAELEGKLPA